MKIFMIIFTITKAMTLNEIKSVKHKLIISEKKAKLINISKKISAATSLALGIPYVIIMLKQNKSLRLRKTQRYICLFLIISLIICIPLIIIEKYINFLTYKKIAFNKEKTATISQVSK